MVVLIDRQHGHSKVIFTDELGIGWAVNRAIAVPSKLSICQQLFNYGPLPLFLGNARAVEVQRTVHHCANLGEKQCL